MFKHLMNSTLIFFNIQSEFTLHVEFLFLRKKKDYQILVIKKTLHSDIRARKSKSMREGEGEMSSKISSQYHTSKQLSHCRAMRRARAYAQFQSL